MSMVPKAAIILAYPINFWDDDFEDFIISDVHEQNYFGKDSDHRRRAYRSDPS